MSLSAPRNVGVVPLRRDLPGLLRCLATIDAAIAATQERSSHAVERRLQWVRRRRSEAGTTDSGRIRRARHGQCVLRASTIEQIYQHFPEARSPNCPLLWMLVTGKNTVPNDPYAFIGDSAFYAVHKGGVLARIFAVPRDFLSDEDLTRLTLQGTYDAVAVLWLLLADTSHRNSTEDRLRIASYLPPAFALLSRDPSAHRVALILFARARQLVLDSVGSDGRRLALETYDLREVADSVPELPTHFAVRNPGRRPPNAVPSEMSQWLKTHQGSVVSGARRRGVWTRGLSPLEQLSRNTPPEALAPEAVHILREALGKYA